MKEQDLADRIEATLFYEFFNETGVITINVENGFIRWINLDIEQDEEYD